MQSPCRHLLVDEFQDLTPAHVLLLRLLSLPALDVFGVGDDDQVIYRHAGADPAFLIDFADAVPRRRLAPADRQLPLSGRGRDCGARTCSATTTGGSPSASKPGRARTRRSGPFGWSSTIRTTGRAVARGRRDRTGWPSWATTRPTIAVLARVNSLLLAPHVALHEAGVPSAVRAAPRRARIAPACAPRLPTCASPARPGRSRARTSSRSCAALPEACRSGSPIGSRRRSVWTSAALRRIAGNGAGQGRGQGPAAGRRPRPGRRRRPTAARPDRSCSPCATPSASARRWACSTAPAAARARATSTTSRPARVADLHPDPATLRALAAAGLQREAAADGVTLSTVHRVKGREWDRVVVFGVSRGILPHRLAEDVEEERTGAPRRDHPRSPPGRRARRPHRAGRRSSTSWRARRPAGVPAAPRASPTEPGTRSAPPCRRRPTASSLPRLQGCRVADRAPAASHRGPIVGSPGGPQTVEGRRRAGAPSCV